MKNFCRTCWCLVAFIIPALAPISRGQIIYDNIGSGPTAFPGGAWAIGGPPKQEVAYRFVVPTDTFLDYAELSLSTPFGGTPKALVAIMTNATPSLPGTVLEQVAVALPSSSSPFPYPLSRAEFSNTVFLTAGTFYWIAVSGFDAGTNTGWLSTGRPFGFRTFDLGELGFEDGWAPASITEQGGMRIVGTPTPAAVPEPSTFGVIGACFVGLVAWVRRRAA